MVKQLLIDMLKVPRLSASMRCSMRCSMSCSMRCPMSCSISMMRTMFLLVAMLMVSSVSGRTVENLLKETEADPASDDVVNIARRQDTDTVLCGRRPAVRSKRHVGDEPTDDGDNSDQLDKLLHSYDVTHGEVPWHATVYANNYSKCGGAIINEFWVMTTAACVYPTHTRRATIVVGDNSVSLRDSGEQTFRASHFYLRAGFEFEGSNWDYNLALIKVASTSDGRGIRFNNYVQPICLPEAGESPPIGALLTISGSGMVNLRNYASRLQKFELPVFDYNACKSIYPEGQITERMMCAGQGTTPRNTGACAGDEGSPATYKSGDIHILAGIVSSTQQCQPPTEPIILTSIPADLQWIRTVISLHSNNTQGVLPRRTA